MRFGDMAERQVGWFLRSLCRLVGGDPTTELTDGQLLERFARQQDEAALAALVQRHGGLVLGVCRRVLGNTHDAEDAFQATFIILLRKARSLDRHGTLANWLYTVAYHAALRARASAARRRTEER